MNKQYKKQENESDTTIWFEENNVRISFNETPGNRHYEEYLAWISEGNTPEVIND